jgi:hypothetical protein
MSTERTSASGAAGALAAARARSRWAERACGGLLAIAASGALAWAPAPAPGDTLRFAPAAGTKLRKAYKAEHELRIDQIAYGDGEGGLVADGSSGWVSGTQRLVFRDEYVRVDAARPRELVRTYEEMNGNGTLTVAQGGADKPKEKPHTEKSRAEGPLQGNRVRFTWVDEEQGYSRCLDAFDDEESLVVPLRCEFDYLGLLPPGEVATGDTWSVDPVHAREILAPGGDLSMTPTGGNLFGRTMEIGVAGDFADFLQEFDGTIQATYGGTREVEGTADRPAARVGVVALDLHLIAHADRTQLYRMAMPQNERRRPERLEAALLDYALTAKGELLWDLDRGHFHALSLEGQETFTATVSKTLPGAEPKKLVQQSQYSGKLDLGVTASDGSDERASGASEKTKSAKKKKKK